MIQVILMAGVLICLFLTGCEGEYQRANITVDDFRFSPSLIHLQAGQPTRLVVRNQGREQHQFNSRIFSHSQTIIRWNSKGPITEGTDGVALASGERLDIVLTLEPGEYVFRCRIKGHNGMKGIFVVEGAGSKSSDL